MKARLIRANDNSLQLLYANGIISPAEPVDLVSFLSDFKNISRNGVGEQKWSDVCVDMTIYPGETLGFVTDDGYLVLQTFEPFIDLLDSNYKLKQYLSVIEFAKKHGKSREMIKVFCREGRILGATKKGGVWMIPEDAPYPVPTDRRREGYRGYKKPRPRKEQKESE